MPQHRERKIDDIVLCLSGGGFRAAAFHLGTLDVLARLGLLDKVRVLSTASGGTFVGAAWALALARSDDFAGFFTRTYRALRDLQLPEKVAGEMARLPGPRSLIRAAASVYDRELFGGEKFGRILEADGALRDLDVVFNATEFRTGLAFRFQKSTRQARIGNGRVWLEPTDAAALRIADVVAASSCFPGGFEPLLLPDDFAGLGPDASVLREQPRPAASEPLALMDGGIDDNQAIESGLVAALRRRIRRPFFLVSDTTQPMTPFAPAPRPARRGRFTVGHLVGLALVAPPAGVAAMAVHLIWKAGATGLQGRDALLAIPLLVLAASSALLLGAWQRAQRALAAVAPGLDRRLLTIALGLGLREAWAAVRDRARSLQTLAANVFMARVRRLMYSRIWSDRELTGRRIAILVYDLTRPQPVPEWLSPTAEMRQVVSRAVGVPTILWFTDPEQLRDLVTAGQVTTCFNVLQYLGREREQPAAGESPLAGRALSLWQELRADVFAALGARLAEGEWRAKRSAAPGVAQIFGG